MIRTSQDPALRVGRVMGLLAILLALLLLAPLAYDAVRTGCC